MPTLSNWLRHMLRHIHGTRSNSTFFSGGCPALGLPWHRFTHTGSHPILGRSPPQWGT